MILAAELRLENQCPVHMRHIYPACQVLNRLGWPQKLIQLTCMTTLSLVPRVDVSVEELAVGASLCDPEFSTTHH